MTKEEQKGAAMENNQLNGNVPWNYVHSGIQIILFNPMCKFFE